MRIATYQQATWTKSELGKVQSKVSYHQQQVSSGKKHIRMSEEPMMASKTLAVKHAIRGVEKTERDIKDAEGVLSTTESALQGMQQALDRVNQLTIQALSGTNSQENLSAVATEVEGLMKQMIYLGNTKHDGSYIFAGDQYSNKPFTDDGTFQGGQQDVSWKLSESYSVPVFQGGGTEITKAIETLKTMTDQLRAGDTTGLRESMKVNQENNDGITNLISEVGATGSTLQALKDILSEQKLGLEEHRSSVEDVDMVEAVSDLSYMNGTYQAMLQSVSMMNKVSILNYM